MSTRSRSLEVSTLASEPGSIFSPLIMTSNDREKASRERSLTRYPSAPALKTRARSSRFKSFDSTAMRHSDAASRMRRRSSKSFSHSRLTSAITSLGETPLPIRARTLLKFRPSAMTAKVAWIQRLPETFPMQRTTSDQHYFDGRHTCLPEPLLYPGAALVDPPLARISPIRWLIRSPLLVRGLAIHFSKIYSAHSTPRAASGGCKSISIVDPP